MGVAYNSRIITDGLVLALDAANNKSILSTVEVLVVAGGGGGGGWGGGGGAGGLIYSSIHTITPGSAITATVGDGGSAGAAGYTSGGDGTNSVFGALTAIGGGGGGHYPGVSGRNGGSGGGGGGNEGSSVQPGGTGTSGQGFSGGTSNSRNDGNYWGAGGGGGASEVGENAVGLQGGNGGNGLSFNISGTSQFYAGGGGGHTPNAPGTAITTVGGLGGGGAGGRYYQSITAISGTPNTGGGGGGGYAGAAGGSGIIIVRYPGSQRATGGTVTSVGGYTIHTFTTSGTFTPTWGDMSTNGNTGTLTNGVGYSASNGGSLSFDGTNDYVSVPYNSVLNTPNGVTYSIWIYATSTGEFLSRGTSDSGATPDNPRFYINVSDKSIYFDWSSPGIDQYVSTSSNSFNSNVWINVVGMCIAGGRMDVYINGYLSSYSVRSNADNMQNPLPNTNQEIQIGGATWVPRYFGGNIAQVSIYNRALSAAEISQNFNALRGRFGI
jgi:hypothetical protein